MPSSACSRPHPPLHSFPTRRSSDLPGCLRRGGAFVRRGARHHLLIARPPGRLAYRQLDALRLLRLEQAATREDHHTQRRRQRQPSIRSEEHTSELQSRRDLVCRLLLAPAPTHLYTLSLHDALPISPDASGAAARSSGAGRDTISSLLARPGALLTGSSTRLGSSGWNKLQPAKIITPSAADNDSHRLDRKSTRLNSSHVEISYAVFCLLPPPPTSTLFPYTTLFRSPRMPPARRRVRPARGATPSPHCSPARAPCLPAARRA